MNGQGNSSEQNPGTLSDRQRLASEKSIAGIRDVIQPGDNMKELTNKVTEAKKAVEANLIVCRDNCDHTQPGQHRQGAKYLEGKPTFMPVSSGKLNIVLREKGLVERVVSLL